MVEYTFNPSSQGDKGDKVLYEFEASMIYRVSSRTARYTEEFCLKKIKKKKLVYLFFTPDVLHKSRV